MFVRWLRRSLMTLGVLSLLPLIGSLAFWLWRPTRVPKDSVLHVVLDGTAAEAPPGPLGALVGQDGGTLVDLTHKLRAAGDDPRILAVLFEVREPQFGLAQIEELARATAAFHAKGKPSFSFLETAGEASRGDGAYVLAALAQNIMLAPSGQLSLHGMRQQVPFAKGAFDKFKVDVHVEQRYEYKNFADTFGQRGFTPAHKESVVSLSDDLQQTYLGIVAQHRQVTNDEVVHLVTASPWQAEEALAGKWVDQLGFWDDMLAAMDSLAERKDPLVDIGSYVPPKPRGKSATVAYVVASGEIGRGKRQASPVGEPEGIGSQVFAEALRQAREDKVAAVLMRLDSPGGSYLASDIIRREVALTRDANVPIVVSMGNVAASGGYFIAAAADHIVAEASSITGSIGVVSVSFAIRRALRDFLGLTFEGYDSLPHPGALSEMDPPDEAQRAKLAAQIDFIYHDFVDKVAHARGTSYETIHTVAKGRVWTGRQALARGLVDELGGIDVAAAHLKKRLGLPDNGHLVLQVYPEPPTAWDLVRDTLQSEIRAARLWGQVAQVARTLQTQVGLGSLTKQGWQARLESSPDGV